MGGKKTRREFLVESGIGGGLAAASPLLVGAGPRAPQRRPDGLVARWRFGDLEDGTTLDEVGEIRDPVHGRFRALPGIEGGGLGLDGTTTRVVRAAAEAPRLAAGFSVEAWLALAAYPWNWCPVIARQEDRTRGFELAIGPAGEPGLFLSADGVYYRSEWRTCIADARIPLRRWVHLAGVFDPESGLHVYLDGEPVGRLEMQGRFVAAPAADLILGSIREPEPASHPHRASSNLPTWYSLDGILDEVRVYDVPLQAEEVAAHGAERPAASEPELPPRRMPSGPAGPGRFGAYYATLAYTPEWDSLWHVGEHADVVVQFDDSPIRVVFWRGTSYGPAWVMEDGTWITDQSVEGWDERGTYEHMNDPRCHHSQVRVLESHAARVVVHWRYALVNTREELWRREPRSGMGCWIDEIHTFWPDGVGVRKITWDHGSVGRPRQFQETLPLCQPGQRAEDILHLDAITLANLRGETHTYSWPGAPGSRERMRPDGASLQMVNLRSRNRPFLAFEPGTRIRVLGEGPRRGLFSAFPMANHWPVAMIPSDGRTCVAPDRPAHLSPAISAPVVHEEPGGRDWTAWLAGTTESALDTVVPLARSWSQPAELRVVDGDARGSGYDPGQRCWLVDAVSAPLRLRLEASPDAPLVNPALQVRGWEGPVPGVRVDGRRVADARVARVPRIEGVDLIVFLPMESDEPIELELVS